MAKFCSLCCVSLYFKKPNARAALSKALGDSKVSFWDPEEIPLIKEELRGCDVLLTDAWHLPSLLDKLGKVKWVHCTSAGVEKMADDKRFQDAVKEGSFSPLITRTSYTSTMAAYCLGYIFQTEFNFKLLDEQQKQKIWLKNKKRLLESVTVGILGVGDVGQGVALACKHFNMRTIGLSSKATSAQGFDEVYKGDLNGVLRESDYVISALPQTPATIGLLNGDVFSHSKEKSPVFINIGRGTVVDEASLIGALDKNWISHAVLDVFHEEPLPAESPLWAHPGVTITPHISGGPLIEDTYPYIIESFCANLAKFNSNEKLYMEYDYKKGY